MSYFDDPIAGAIFLNPDNINRYFVLTSNARVSCEKNLTRGESQRLQELRQEAIRQAYYKRFLKVEKGFKAEQRDIKRLSKDLKAAQRRKDKKAVGEISAQINEIQGRVEAARKQAERDVGTEIDANKNPAVSAYDSRVAALSTNLKGMDIVWAINNAESSSKNGGKKDEDEEVSKERAKERSSQIANTATRIAR